jgi:hypothetical protein
MITTPIATMKRQFSRAATREWAEDQELRQQELDRLAVEMFLQSKAKADGPLTLGRVQTALH